MAIGVYIHFPFCGKKCPYCDFYSVAYSKELAEKYKYAVIRNIRDYSQKFGKIHIDTIYFGGGTPSLVDGDYWSVILGEIYKNFIVISNPEVTIEANPSGCSKARLENLYKNGINRISLGVQSLNAAELVSLGRTHTPITAVNAINNAYSAGFRNISADVMLGILGQDTTSLRKTISALAVLPLTHISTYILKIEEGTDFFYQKIQDKLPDDDHVADIYLSAVKTLNDIGFRQYEISNFAKNGFKSQHNLHYWNCEEYIGIGPGAHSYFNGKRYGVPRDLAVFIDSNVQQIEITDENPGTFEEFAMLKFRLMEGINLCSLQDKFGFNADQLLKKCKIFIDEKLINYENGSISLSPTGCLISNKIIGDLFFG